MIFYAAMVGAGYAIEFLFGALHLIPATRSATVLPETITWNYTTWLNLVAIAASALLFWRFLKTGGPEMLRMMNKAPETNQARHRH